MAKSRSRPDKCPVTDSYLRMWSETTDPVDKEISTMDDPMGRKWLLLFGGAVTGLGRIHIGQELTRLAGTNQHWSFSADENATQPGLTAAARQSTQACARRRSAD